MMKRPRLSYHLKLFIGLLIYSWILVAALTLFQYHREKTFKAEELNATLQTINSQILRQIDTQSDASIPDLDLGWYPFDDIRVTIMNRDGKLVYDNTIDTTSDSHLDRPEIVAALNNGGGYDTRRHSSSTGDTYFYSALAGKNYIVRTAVPYSGSLLQMLGVDYGFVWFMSSVTLLMCIGGYFVTKRLGQHQEDERTALKRQLTNNINHELKTPLASIQVCLETLISHPELPDEKRRDFIERCWNNSQRLKSLLDDVATITRMDDGGTAISHHSVNLRTIIDEVCTDLELRATENNITITNHVIGDFFIDGNSDLLFSIFRNLIDNAILHSGGTNISIDTTSISQSSITIVVADDGVGVAEQHLPRLFERFYRVDKGRSRQLGGTGLGLSIVKNAVLFHGGTIAVSNRQSPQHGLVFTMTLKAENF